GAQGTIGRRVPSAPGRTGATRPVRVGDGHDRRLPRAGRPQLARVRPAGPGRGVRRAGDRRRPGRDPGMGLGLTFAETRESPGPKARGLPRWGPARPNPEATLRC